MGEPSDLEELVRSFQDVTQTNDDTARFFLSAADGDLQRALDTYLAGGVNPDIDQAAGTSNAPTSGASRGQAPNEGGASRLQQRQAPQRVAGRGLMGGGGLFGLAMRAVGATMNMARGILSVVAGALLPTSWYQALRATTQRLSTSERGQADREPLPTRLKAEYGASMLDFNLGGWEEALSASRAASRPLLVYIHSPDHEDTPKFCRDVLCDPDTTAFFCAHYVCFATSAASSLGSSLITSLQVSTYPYLAALSLLRGGGRGDSGGDSGGDSATPLRMLAAVEGLCGAARVRNTFSAAAEASVARGAAAARGAAVHSEARSLRAEQDAALEASMAADRQRREAAEAVRQAQKDEAAAAQRQQEAEAARQADEERAKEQRAAAIEVRRAEASASLPAEPPAGPPGTSSLIRLRLPNGGTVTRRFSADAAMLDVYRWVDSCDETTVWEYVLTSTFPRREFERVADGGLSVKDAGLVPNAALMLIARDD